MRMFIQDDGAPRALVLLPGAQMHPADVQRAGLPRQLAESGVTLDLYVPDLHLDPTGRFDALQHLEAEVLAPLRARYAELWLGGISLGGLLALLYAQRRPQGLRGLCLLSPYAGSRLTINAIQRAGGLADRFAGAMADVAQRLPQAHAVQVPQGHDWTAWLPLWSLFLHRLDAAGEGSG